MEVNSDRLNAFMGKMITEVGAAMNAARSPPKGR